MQVQLEPARHAGEAQPLAVEPDAGELRESERLPSALAGSSLRHCVSALHWSDRKSTRLNSSHGYISYAVFCLKKKKLHRAAARLPERAHRPCDPAKPPARHRTRAPHARGLMDTPFGRPQDRPLLITRSVPSLG